MKMRMPYIVAAFLFCIIAINPSTTTFSQNLRIGKGVQVNINAEWTDSGLYVSIGDTVFLSGFGAYSPWSSGDQWFDMSVVQFGIADNRFTVPGFPGGIIARIGVGDTLIASGSQWFISKAQGNLFFSTNDERVSYRDNRGTVVVLVKVIKKRGTTRVTDDNNSPKGFQLNQNYPNPFNPSTTIEYTVEQPGRVHLEIYNALGQLVRTLVDEEKNSGEYSALWDGMNDSNQRVSNGTYFYRIKVGNFVSNKKMLLLQ